MDRITPAQIETTPAISPLLAIKKLTGALDTHWPTGLSTACSNALSQGLSVWRSKDGLSIISTITSTSTIKQTKWSAVFSTLLATVASTALPLLVLLTLSACSPDTEKPIAAQPTTAKVIPLPITAATVTSQRLSNEFSVRGIAQAFQKATIAAQTGGRIVARHVEPGAEVLSGDLLVSIDDQRAQLGLKEAKARQQAARTGLQQALSEWRRGGELAQQKFISADQLEQLGYAKQSAQANLDAATALAGTAERTLSDTRVKAPFPGIVEAVFIHQGDFVATGQKLISLANFERFRVIAGVTASEAGHLRVGSPAWVSFNDLGNTMLKGTIQSIGHIADPQSGTYPLEVWIERGNETAIREGMIASIMVRHQSEQETLAIPAAALFRQAGQAYVYRIVDNKAQLTAIRAGRTVAGSLEITAGLMVGDTVVVDGMFALRDGVAINITHTVPQPATSSSTHTARTPH